MFMKFVIPLNLNLLLIHVCAIDFRWHVALAKPNKLAMLNAITFHCFASCRESEIEGSASHATGLFCGTNNADSSSDNSTKF